MIGIWIIQDVEGVMLMNEMKQLGKYYFRYMKKHFIAPLIIFFISCSIEVLDGKYRVIKYNDYSMLHFEQYFSFSANEFRNYMIKNGKKVVDKDSLQEITYSYNNTFSHIRKDSLYVFKYSINQDTLKLEIGKNIITLLKQ